ncbi:hypothetical protein OK016_05370 [Vibrio chagasii]|nr:hypothetical protein [Vibrio chagasii]
MLVITVPLRGQFRPIDHRVSRSKKDDRLFSGITTGSYRASLHLWFFSHGRGVVTAFPESFRDTFIKRCEDAASYSVYFCPSFMDPVPTAHPR